MSHPNPLIHLEAPVQNATCAVEDRNECKADSLLYMYVTTEEEKGKVTKTSYHTPQDATKTLLLRYSFLCFRLLAGLVLASKYLRHLEVEVVIPHACSLHQAPTRQLPKAATDNESFILDREGSPEGWKTS